MALYKYIRELWKNPKSNLGELWKKRLIELRKNPAVFRLERPTRIDRARSIGYKAKKGFIVSQVKLRRGGRMRPKIRAGRRPKHFRHRKIVGKSYQLIAEERASKRYKNCEVIGSYQIAKDAIFYWYEIILVDPSNPVIKADKRFSWISGKGHRGRAFRSLTSAGRKSRGLRKKGIGAEKIRPSLRANMRRAK